MSFVGTKAVVSMAGVRAVTIDSSVRVTWVFRPHASADFRRRAIKFFFNKGRSWPKIFGVFKILLSGKPLKTVVFLCVFDSQFSVFCFGETIFFDSPIFFAPFGAI